MQENSIDIKFKDNSGLLITDINDAQIKDGFLLVMCKEHGKSVCRGYNAKEVSSFSFKIADKK